MNHTYGPIAGEVPAHEAKDSSRAAPPSRKTQKLQSKLSIPSLNLLPFRHEAKPSLALLWLSICTSQIIPKRQKVKWDNQDPPRPRWIGKPVRTRVRPETRSSRLAREVLLVGGKYWPRPRSVGNDDPRYRQIKWSTIACVIRQSPHDGAPSEDLQILLLKRAANSRPSKVWEPPGGLIETSDKTVFAAAARELDEETRGGEHMPAGTGLQLTEVLTQLDDMKWAAFKNTALAYLVAVQDTSQENKLSHEHTDMWWATEKEIDAIPNSELTSEKRLVIDQAFEAHRRIHNGSCF
ncbi:MAG: hypothetical protein Q9159_004321 [Coniocarpon cinnabarinum]